MKKTLTTLAVILGIAFIIIAIYYWVTPANMLPTSMPGYDATMTAVHVKHGIAALVVGLALLVYAWFSSGKKSSVPGPQQ